MVQSNNTLLRATAALATLAAVNAHGFIVSWTVEDGQHPGFDPSWETPDGQPDTAQRHYFEKERGFPDLNSKDTACGARSTEFTSTIVETWPVVAGKEVTALWDQWPIAHKGPILQYMAACPSSGCDGVDAAGLPWFKISEDAYDGTQWASDKLNSSGASWTFKIPAEVAPGKYIIRHELIAMHFAGEPQVYPVCIQANVESSGTFVPTDTVTFPEAYHSQSLSLDYETYNVNQSDSQKFTCPGPAVVDFPSGGGAAAPAASSVAAPAASSVSDTPVASSNGNSEPAATPIPSANSGEATDVANPPGSDGPASSNAPAMSSASPEVSPSNPSVIPAGTGTGVAPSASSTSRGRGRHSRRPREPRSCMAPKDTAGVSSGSKDSEPDKMYFRA